MKQVTFTFLVKEEHEHPFDPELEDAPVQDDGTRASVAINFNQGDALKSKRFRVLDDDIVDTLEESPYAEVYEGEVGKTVNFTVQSSKTNHSDCLDSEEHDAVRSIIETLYSRLTDNVELETESFDIDDFSDSIEPVSATDGER